MNVSTRRAAIAAAAVAVVLALVWWVAIKPKPRLPIPLILSGTGIDRSTVILDRRGRPVIWNFRTVEEGVLYRGSALTTLFTSPDGQEEFGDRTAFEFLQSLNVRHVVALLPADGVAFHAEDGYLRYWSERTGYEIKTTWVPVDPHDVFGLGDRTGLQAAGALIAIMRDREEDDGAVYVHDADGLRHAGVAVAGYELWRNRGWNDFDTSWRLVERRFLEGNRTARDMRRYAPPAQEAVCANGSSAVLCPEWLRAIKPKLRFVIEL